MKNRLLTILLAMTTLMIVGCDEDDEVDPLVGTWDFTTAEVVIGNADGGVTEEICEGTFGLLYDVTWENDECTFAMTSELLGYTMSWTLNANNTLSLTTNSNGQTITVTGTWSVSGTTLTLTSDDPNDTPIIGVYSIAGSLLDFSFTDSSTGYAQTWVFTKQ